MDKLIRVIEVTRSKLAKLRKLSLKEMPTRAAVIDPLLEALGWDVRDPFEVELEYPTVDGRSVDYALLINRKPVLLVEAKALDDSLNDVKGITQVVGYAANAGIVWCILTNGVLWKVYRSVEQCPAPDKLMFEVSLDSGKPEGLTVDQIARQMWRFSREEMAKGTLDAIGERTFTDGKVRKALDGILRDPPRTVVRVVRSAVGDAQLSAQRIKESLVRIWTESASRTVSADTLGAIGGTAPAESRVSGARKAWATRRATPEDEQPQYDESHHTTGRPQEVLELYRTVHRLCFSLKPGEIERRPLAMSMNYIWSKRIFCCVRLLHGGIRIWLKLKFSHLTNPPSFARDVSGLGHYGTGDVELAISSLSELELATPLIKLSFEGQQSR